MRDIRFRAWDKTHKKMFYQTDEWEFCFDELVFPFTSIMKLEVSTNDAWGPYDLMQFTGLHDKNGKEILEGDIVRNKINGITKLVFWNDNALAWSTKTIQTKEKFHEYLCRLDISRNEVIGNVWENPDLLEGK